MPDAKKIKYKLVKIILHYQDSDSQIMLGGNEGVTNITAQAIGSHLKVDIDYKDGSKKVTVGIPYTCFFKRDYEKTK